MLVRKSGTSVADEQGFTLLEYCAGAAVVMLLVYTGMRAMGTSVGQFFGSIGTWAGARATDMASVETAAAPGNGGK